MRLIVLQVTAESLSRKRRPHYELQHARSMVLDVWKLGEERLEGRWEFRNRGGVIEEENLIAGQAAWHLG